MTIKQILTGVRDWINNKFATKNYVDNQDESLNDSISDVANSLDGVDLRVQSIETALPQKQDKLVSGTNIKTVNSTSLLGSGNIAVQPTLVSGTNIKTVNNTSLLGSGNVAVQPTLVSGTNIKTVNSTSLLGSGDVTVQPTLVSGTNIKTINNQSLLGSGNITIQGGGGGDADMAAVHGESGYIANKLGGYAIPVEDDDFAVEVSPTITLYQGDYTVAIPESMVKEWRNGGVIMQLIAAGKSLIAWANPDDENVKGDILYSPEDGEIRFRVDEPLEDEDLGIFQFEIANLANSEVEFVNKDGEIEIQSAVVVPLPSNATPNMQPKLVSGINIKTINNNSVLGTGDIDISGNEDDINQDINGKFQFADRTYNSQTPNGLGYVILRKNKTFAEQVTAANTIYEIRHDFDLGGASFTMPSGCTIRFNGGSIVNGVLNLGGDCVVQGNGIKCGIAEPPAKDTNLSLYLGDTSDSQLNRSVLQEMIDCGAGIIVDTPDLTISDYLEVKTRLKIKGTSNIPKLTFPNSRGFVWTTSGGSTYNLVESLNIVADNDAFDFVNGGAAQRPNNVYFSTFKELRVTSNTGNCFYAGENKGVNGDTCLFDNVFESIYVVAPLGCGFYGLSGNTHRFVKCRCGKCGEAVFYNCAGCFDSFNGSWGGETPTFYKAQGSSASPQRLFCEFVNCNIESFQSVLFACANDYYTYMHLSFVGCTFYVTPNQSAVVDFYPMMFIYLIQLIWKNNLVYIYNNGSYDSTHSFWYIGRFQNCSYDVDAEFKAFYLVGSSLYNSVMNPISTVLKSGLVLSQVSNQSFKTCAKMELGILRADTFIPSFKQIDITSVFSQYLNLTSSDWRAGFVFKHSASLDVVGTQHTIAYFGNPAIRTTELWGAMDGTLTFLVKNGNTNRKIGFSNGFAVAGGFVTKDGSTIVIEPGQCAKFSLVYESGTAKYIVEPYAPKNTGVGSTRPTTSLYIGMPFYDASLNKPIWWDGTGWVDATGTAV